VTARIGVALTGLATLYIVALLVGLPDPPGAAWGRALVHLGELAVLVAVVGSGAAGRRGLGRAGAVVAGLGLVGLAVAEPMTNATADLLFTISPNLVGLGMILLGIAVLQEGAWTGWVRFLPLALGIAVFVVLTPLIIVSGGPPEPLGLVGLLVWEILWVGCGVAALTRSPSPVAA
jgi:hypothetical protein